MSGQYWVYLLRIWLVGNQQPPNLRVMLEDPHTHNTIGFATLDELFHYLSQLEKEVGNAKDGMVGR